MERIYLEMIQLEFDGGLEICTDYQKRAEEAMKELNSEKAAYMARKKKAAIMKGICVVVGSVGGEQILLSL